MRLMAFLLTLIVSTSAWGAPACPDVELGWQNPTQNDDGSRVTGLSKLDIFYEAPGKTCFSSLLTVNPDPESRSLPLDCGDYRFFMTATDLEGDTSSPSNVVRYIDGVQLKQSPQAITMCGTATPPDPDPQLPAPLLLELTYEINKSVSPHGTGEVSPVTITHVESVRNIGQNTGPFVTFAAAPQANDRIVWMVHSNSAGVTVTPPTGFTQIGANFEPAGESSTIAAFSKVAGASEGANFDGSLSSSEFYQVIGMVFRADNPIILGLALATSLESSNSTDIIVSAINGRTVPAGHMNVVFGGKDNRSGTGLVYSTANQGFTGALGIVNEQITAAAHKLQSAAETYSGNVTIEVAGGSDGQPDRPYGIHFTFVEESSSIAANAENIEITENVANVTLGAGTNIASVLESLSVIENQTDTDLDSSIASASESLVMSELGANVVSDTSINSDLENLSFVSSGAVVNLARAISASLEQVVLQTATASILQDIPITATLETLNIDEPLVSIQVTQGIAAAIESLLLNEQAADTQQNVALATGLETLLSATQVTDTALNRDISVAVESLDVTEFAVLQLLDIAIQAQSESLEIDANAAVSGLGLLIAAQAEVLNVASQDAVTLANTAISAALEQVVVDEDAALASLSFGVNVLQESLGVNEHQAAVQALSALAIEATLEQVLMSPENAIVVKPITAVIRALNAVFDHERQLTAHVGND